MVSIDGVDISSATIDGTDVSEITIDGEVAWTAIPDSGVSRYEFEQDVTDSWDGNDGTDNTSAGYSTTAKRGTYSKDFDGVDDYVEISSLGGITTDSDFTLTCWVYFDGITDDYPRIVSKEDSNGADAGLYYHNFDNEYRGVFPNNEQLATGVSKSDGVWCFLAQKLEGSTGYVYVDANQEASGSVQVADNGAVINIGRRPSQNYFHGKVDDVRWYNSALSDSRIQDIYNGNE